MSSSLSSMPLEEFAGYVDALIERSLNGEILPREEVVSLLELDPQSPHVALLAEKAKAMSLILSGGQGRVWSALGVDRCPCAMSCSFCSLAAAKVSWQSSFISGSDMSSWASSISCSAWL